jgi:hypothetical protein
MIWEVYFHDEQDRTICEPDGHQIQTVRPGRNRKHDSGINTKAPRNPDTSWNGIQEASSGVSWYWGFGVIF